MIAGRCPMLSSGIPSNHTTKVNISSKNTTSDNIAAQQSNDTIGEMIPIQEISRNTENIQSLKNGISKDFKLFTTINKRIIVELSSRQACNKRTSKRI